jgi:beta-glucanase (GH16 family)
MLKFSLCTLVFLMAVSVNAQQNRKLIWSDEFNYTGLPDSTKWGYEEGFVRNQEPQYYTVRRLENCRVEHGMLVIESRKEQYPNPAFKTGSDKPAIAEYTSASINTLGKFGWQYGRVEVRAKVPAGAGSWPAIWMMGENRQEVKWPQCGEIDVMEYLGRDPLTVYGTVHYADSANKYAHQGGTDKGGQPADGFHIYAMDWYPDRLEFYYDSVKYFVFDTRKGQRGTENIFSKKFYLLLNLALGHTGSWAGPVGEGTLPGKYYVDYVRIYQ